MLSGCLCCCAVLWCCCAVLCAGCCIPLCKITTKRSLTPNRFEDWYGISESDIVVNGGSPLLTPRLTSGSTKKTPIFAHSVVVAVFKEHEWCVWKFTKSLTRAFWIDKANQVHYLEYPVELYSLCMLPALLLSLIIMPNKLNPAATGDTSEYNSLTSFQFLLIETRYIFCKLGFVPYTDWYKITTHNFIENNGIGLLSLYKNSTVNILHSVLPSNSCKAFVFCSTPKLLGNENLKKYLGLNLFSSTI